MCVHSAHYVPLLPGFYVFLFATFSPPGLVCIFFSLFVIVKLCEAEQWASSQPPLGEKCGEGEVRRREWLGYPARIPGDSVWCPIDPAPLG